MTVVTLPLGIVADDLTGALDAAAPFAARGHRTLVAILAREGRWVLPDAPIRSVSTDSRMLPAGTAATRTVAAARQVRGASLFKKIDSLLRGNLGAEVAATIAARRPALTLVAPAVPALGRRTLGGVQYLHGQVVGSGAPDPFAPAGTPNIVDLLAAEGCRALRLPLSAVRDGQAALISALGAASATGVVVADAEHQTDLEALVTAGLASGVDILWCGAAGLAAALAATLPYCTPTGQGYKCPVLVLCGSLNPQARLQCADLADRAAVRTLDLTTSISPEALARATRAALACSPCVLLAVPSTDGAPSREARGRLLRHIEATVRALGWNDRLGLVATGGDTAVTALRGLGATYLDVRGEVSPGLAHSILRGGPSDGMEVITKAGSFGDVSALWRATSYLRQRE